MRRTTTRRPGEPDGMRSTDRFWTKLAVSGGMFAAFFAALLAVSFPGVAVGVVLTVVALVTARTVRRRLTVRRRERRTFRLCVPGTDVCLEA